MAKRRKIRFVAEGEISVDFDTIGKEIPSVVLVGSLKIEDDQAVFRLSHVDYHAFAMRDDRIGLCSGVIAKRAEYPHWPDPEPCAECGKPSVRLWEGKHFCPAHDPEAKKEA